MDKRFIKAIILLLSMIVLNNFNVDAQKNDCLTDFDFLIKKIKDDYPGYSDKVSNATKDELFNLELQLREKIIKYSESCFSCLDKYASFFKDRHLWVYLNENKVNTDENFLSISTYEKMFLLNSDSLFKAASKTK